MLVLEPPKTPFQDWLRKHRACHGARMWVGHKTLAQAWRLCPNADWMNWLLVALYSGAPGSCGCALCRWGVDSPKDIRAAAKRSGMTFPANL
jgi:hypothetical protein